MANMQLILEAISQWAIPATILLIVTWAWYKRVPMYESFVTGAKEGFDIAVMIIPYLVAMLLVIKVFLASGIFEDIKHGLGGAMEAAGMGEYTETLDLLPLAFVRPLTGSGSRGLVVEMLNTHGADSFIGNVASLLYGSSETTLYIITLYYGAAQIKKIRHTLAACLSADALGVIVSIVLGYWLFGS